MRLLGLWVLWLLVYFGTMYAGDWYESYFHFYQAAASFLLMQVALRYIHEWWRAEYATICVLHILHNVGDRFFDFPARNYNDIQAILNVFEVIVLFGAGGITQLIRWWHGNNSACDSGSNSHRELKRGSQGTRGNA